MSQGLHTSYGEVSLKFKGANSKQEKVDVGVAKNNFGWKLRGKNMSYFQCGDLPK